MFGSIIKAATSTAKAVDATVGLVTKPLTDAADFYADGINELLGEDDDRRK